MGDRVDLDDRLAGYAGLRFRLRGLAELIAETTTHHLDSDPQLNAWPGPRPSMIDLLQ
ncbi:hypothetical protein [Streptomyces triticagri]|uniref:hypothetical protein n=1 Tax=Streptomyces triticagri TaxID=2293568 RepID=UPI00131404EE|nr:hypothetical protein [Streptomyces triticagri]